jgi:hypothetical protein
MFPSIHSKRSLASARGHRCRAERSLVGSPPEPGVTCLGAATTVVRVYAITPISYTRTVESQSACRRSIPRRGDKKKPPVLQTNQFSSRNLVCLRPGRLHPRCRGPAAQRCGAPPLVWLLALHGVGNSPATLSEALLRPHLVYPLASFDVSGQWPVSRADASPNEGFLLCGAFYRFSRLLSILRAPLF